jgi:hypothetical protein
VTSSELDQARHDIVRWAAEARTLNGRIAKADRLVAAFMDQDPPEDLQSELNASEQLCVSLRAALAGEAS